MFIPKHIHCKSVVLKTKKNTNHTIRNIDITSPQKLPSEIKIEINIDELLKKNNNKKVIRYE